MTQSSTVLLTIGRLPVALDLARSFRAAGWRVVVADPLGMHLCRMSRAVDRCHRVASPREDADRYLDDLRRIVADEAVALVVPTSEESVRVTALSDEVPVFGMPHERTLALHDKLRFAELAASHGLAVPETALAGDEAAGRIAAAGDFVVKPRHSCSGRGVRVHRRGEPLPRDPGLVVQRHLPGELVSGFAVAREGRVLGSAVYRGAIMSGSVAVAFERVDAAAAERWVRAFVERTGHGGFVAFDLVLGDDGEPAAIECNPRATSGIHFLETRALAPAIAGTTGEPIGPRDAPLLAESYSAFTAVLAAAGDPARLVRLLRRLRAARDVSWSPEDPWPFLLMMVNTWPILLRAIRARSTFAEVAVADVEWRDP